MSALNAGKERVDNYAETIIKEAICVKVVKENIFLILKKVVI